MKLRVLIILLMLTCAAWAQEDWVYSPAVPIPQEAGVQLSRAAEIGSYAFDEARDIYLNLADQYPGTALGGDSLLGAMYEQILMSDAPGVEATRQRLLAEYPGSRYEVYAKRHLLEQQIGRAAHAERLAAYSDFLDSFGAPRLERIMAGQEPEAVVQQALALPFEIRVELAKAYYHCVNLPSQREQKINLAKFGQQAFGTIITPDMSFRSDLESILGGPSGKSRIIGLARSRPSITVLSPTPNSTVGTQPTIKLQISSGDWRNSQVELGTLSLKLDGEQQKNRALIQTEIDETLTDGVDFEVLTLKLSPTLAPGTHTAEVIAHTGSLAAEDNTTTVTWSFTVSDNPPPPPTTETRSATKDALVFEKSPHSNEGANPRLTLEKINGKAARNLLGFNLADLDTSSLTSATLVLSIDPSDQVTGWGNGEAVTVKPVTVAWQEGNGKKHGLPVNQQTAGNGAGTTWFSPTDENISNGSANAVVQWNGAATYATAGTAPSLTVHNQQTGELRFDVTDDVLNGVTHGWLLRKDTENKGSKVSFYSREGGGANLGPRLILEYGGPTAMSVPQQIYSAVVGFFGITTRPVSLQASSGVSEGPKGLKEFLHGSARSAFVGEQVMLGFVGRHPLTQLGARVVYRSWLRETPSLV